MSLHLIRSETLKNIADEVRALACTSEVLTLTKMIDNLCDSNTECTTQCDLIAQIQAELENKANFNTIYIGSTEPTNDIGVNGDIYIVRSETT